MRISDWSSDVCSSDLHMVIGNNVTVSRDDHARARGPGRPARLLLASTGSVKKIKEVIERKLLSAAVTVVHWVSCLDVHNGRGNQIGRASCRERGCQYV